MNHQKKVIVIYKKDIISSNFYSYGKNIKYLL